MQDVVLNTAFDYIYPLIHNKNERNLPPNATFRPNIESLPLYSLSRD